MQRPTSVNRERNNLRNPEPWLTAYVNVQVLSTWENKRNTNSFVLQIFKNYIQGRKREGEWTWRNVGLKDFTSYKLLK